MTINRGILSMTQAFYQSIGKPAFDELRNALMLPAEYEIEAVTAYPYRVELTLFNAALPNWPADTMVQLKPVYTHTYTPDGENMRHEAKFDHMDVTLPERTNE